MARWWWVLGLGLVGCQEYNLRHSADLNALGLEEGYFADHYVQASANNRVDVLWVVDNSCSMAGEVDVLGDTFRVFINAFVALGLDYQIGVVTTDMVDPTHSGRLQGPTGVITPDSDDPASAFRAATDQGAEGSDDERGLQAAYTALSEPLISNANAGLVRDDSHLSIIVVTDEDDRSPINARDFSDWLDAYQGDPDLTSFSAVAGPARGLLPCVTFASGVSAEPAPEYAAVVDRTDGLHLPICDMDMSAILGELAIEASGLETIWELTEVPTKPGLIEVFVDLEPVPHSYTEGVSYLPGPNAIEFHGSYVPRGGDTILVVYPIE